MKIISCRFLTLSTLFLLAACSQTEPQGVYDKVTVQLKWVHQAQFAGFYMAKEKGYYAQERLDVDFLEGGLKVNTVQSLLTGQADFSVVASEMVILERQGEKAPITAIAAIYRRSATVYVAKKESGIKHPADFSGKTIAALSAGGGAIEFEYQIKAMMKKMGLDISKTLLVPYDPSYKGFVDGSVDITAAYFTSGVNRLRNQEGFELNLIWPGDYGIHLYSDTLITTEKMIEERSDLVERFLRASLRGWQYAIGQGDEAIAVTLKYTRVKDKAVQQSMLNALRPLVHTGDHHLGWMADSVWEQMHSVLLENNILSEALKDFDKVYTMKFLHAVYGKNNP